MSLDIRKLIGARESGFNSGGFEARLIQSNLVIYVVGVGFRGFQVVINGSIVILQVNRMATGIIVFLGFRAPRRKHRHGKKDHKLAPSAHVLSGISTQGKPSLYYLMESSIGFMNPASAWIL